MLFREEGLLRKEYGSFSLGVGTDGVYFNKQLATKTPLEEKIELCAIDHIESLMGDFEKGLDYMGVVPVLSTGSGIVRFGYGLIQIICASALRLISEVALAVGARNKDSKDFWNKWNNRAVYHQESGTFNMVRSTIESVPVIGNAFCFAQVSERETFFIDKYDIWCNRLFYEGELKMMHLKIQKQANINLNSVENKSKEDDKLMPLPSFV